MGATYKMTAFCLKNYTDGYFLNLYVEKQLSYIPYILLTF